MKTAIANRTFKRSDNKALVRMGDRFTASEKYVAELERNGMVRSVAAMSRAPETKQDPTQAVGERSSASPAALVYPKQTARKSGRGVRRKKAEASSL
tara:strand:+ start:3025 stop:3315 length:291 start_codon:yes stop_codon:yes gene_type:complete